MQTTDSTIAEHWRSKTYRDISSYTTSPAPVWYQEAFHTLFRGIMVDDLCRWVGPGPLRRIIDLGCGVGDWTVRYGAFGRTVVGVDISPAFVAAAEQAAGSDGVSGRVTFRTMDLLGFDEYDGAELVCLGACSQLLCDADLARLLGRIGRAQRPGGRIYLRTSIAYGPPPRVPCRTGHYRQRGWYDRLFRRLGYRIDDAFHTHAKIVERVLRDCLRVQSPVAARALGLPLWAGPWLWMYLGARGDVFNWKLVRTAGTV